MQLSEPLLRRPAPAATYDEAISLLEAYVAEPLGDRRDRSASNRLGKLQKARETLAR